MDGGAWCPWGCKELDTTERLHFHFLGTRRPGLGLCASQQAVPPFGVCGGGDGAGWFRSLKQLRKFASNTIIYVLPGEELKQRIWEKVLPVGPLRVLLGYKAAFWMMRRAFRCK